MADDDGFVTAYATPSVTREPTQAEREEFAAAQREGRPAQIPLMSTPVARLSEEERGRIDALMKEWSSAPVMSFSGMDPGTSLSSLAYDRLMSAARSIVEAHGFDSSKYGVNSRTFEIEGLV